MNPKFLKQIPFFSHLDDKKMKIVSESFAITKFKKGDTVIHQGNEGYGMYVIISGKVELERDGKKITTLGEDDFFGEMSLISNELRSATIKVISEDLVTLFLSKVIFREIEESLGEKVKQEISKRNIEDYGMDYAERSKPYRTPPPKSHYR